MIHSATKQIPPVFRVISVIRWYSIQLPSISETLRKRTPRVCIYVSYEGFEYNGDCDPSLPGTTNIATLTRIVSRESSFNDTTAYDVGNSQNESVDTDSRKCDSEHY